jgi:REP element-mobilizing transposase RayT
MFDPKKHHRKSTRLKGYDYASMGYYFITVNSKDKRCIFGEIKDGIMYPTILGRIIEEEWKITGEIRKNIILHEYVVMPNHFHALVEICYSENKENIPGEFKAPAFTLSALVRSFKGAVTRRNNALEIGNKKGVWHRNFDDRIIRDSRGLLNVKKYIKDNVKNWKGATF